MNTFSRSPHFRRNIFHFFLFVTLFSTIIFADFTSNPTELDFGGDDNNPDDESEEEPITLSNTFGFNLSNFDYSFSKDSSHFHGTLNKNDITIDTLPNELEGDDNIGVDVSFTIPKGMDAVDDDDVEEQSFSLGTLSILAEDVNTSTQYTTDIDLNLQVENQLQITGVKMEVDGETENVADGSSKEIPSDESVTFTVEFENTFDDITFEEGDITVMIDIEDLDDKDEESGKDLEGGEEDEIAIGFSINEEDEDEYDVVIKLLGNEEHGGLHGEKIEFTLDIIEPDNTDDEDDVDTNTDSDNDGVIDIFDQCSNTQSGCDVEVDGCPIDMDKDGICDGNDQTPNGEKEEKTDVNIPQQTENNEPVKKETKKEEKEEPEEIDYTGESDGSSVLSFIFGVVVGVIGAACFFILTKI